MIRNSLLIFLILTLAGCTGRVDGIRVISAGAVEAEVRKVGYREPVLAIWSEGRFVLARTQSGKVVSFCVRPDGQMCVVRTVDTLWHAHVIVASDGQPVLLESMLHALPPSEDQLRHVWADRDADPSGTFVVMADQRTLDWVVFRVQGHALQPFVRLRNRDISFTVDRILRLGQDSFVLASSRLAAEEGGKSINE